MKKLILVMLCSALTSLTHAQKCLDINIGSLLGQLQVPGSAASSFGNCVTTKNDHGQTVISNYGAAYSQLDTMVQTNAQAFAMATVNSAGNPAMPSAGTIQSYKDMAAKMQSMTDDQKKAYAMQMAQQMQKQYMTTPPAAMVENPATAKMVMLTRAIVTDQLVPLDNEMAGKFRDLAAQEKAERDAIKTPVYNGCAQVDQVGSYGCSCVNGLDGAYWQQIVAIEDNYNGQKAALLQSYLPRIKALVGNIEDNIAKLHGGDDVKTATFKQMLFSAQSSAFGAAFDISGSIVKDMQKTGSDAYVNKLNCDNKVYNLSCVQGK